MNQDESRRQSEGRRVILYGLSTCDTCRKARAALVAAGREVAFRDIRSDPLSEAERQEFLATFGDRLINRASTTWRGLTEAERSRDANDLIVAYPALMKRPVLRAEDGSLTLGWSGATQSALVGPK